MYKHYVIFVLIFHLMLVMSLLLIMVNIQGFFLSCNLFGGKAVYDLYAVAQHEEFSEGLENSNASIFQDIRMHLGYYFFFVYTMMLLLCLEFR